MSNKQSKSERSRAKDLRQMPADDAPSTGSKKRKRDKPWVLEERFVGPKDSIWAQVGFDDQWRKAKAYAKERDALAAMEKRQRDRWALGNWEYRIVGGE